MIMQWFVLVISLQVGMDDGVARYEDVQIRASSMTSCKYITERVTGLVRIKKPCHQVTEL